MIEIDLQHQFYLNGEEYQLTIVDNAGSDQYTLNHIDLENSDAYILIYAIDDSQRSFFFGLIEIGKIISVLVLKWFRKFVKRFFQQVQIQSIE